LDGADVLLANPVPLSQDAPSPGVGIAEGADFPNLLVGESSSTTPRIRVAATATLGDLVAVVVCDGAEE
jgi:hypothetical protein